MGSPKYRFVCLSPIVGLGLKVLVTFLQPCLSVWGSCHGNGSISGMLSCLHHPSASTVLRCLHNMSPSVPAAHQEKDDIDRHGRRLAWLCLLGRRNAEPTWGSSHMLPGAFSSSQYISPIEQCPLSIEVESRAPSSTGFVITAMGRCGGRGKSQRRRLQVWGRRKGEPGNRRIVIKGLASFNVEGFNHTWGMGRKNGNGKVGGSFSSNRSPCGVIFFFLFNSHISFPE